MFKFNCKRDVDRHVSQMFRKLNENERSNRGFAIAKSYAKVNEYELARDWLQRYLETKSEDASAHKFMGEIYERLQKPEQAITSYQRSYNLNSKQNDIIKNICRLFLINDNWSASPSKAKFWCELAETENVRDDSIFNLRLKMTSSDNRIDKKSIEEMILKEITTKPQDVNLRIKIVKFLMEESRSDEAFKYCFDLEMKFIEVFQTSLDWYNTVASLFVTPLPTDSWNYWCLLLITMDKQIYLNLKKYSSFQKNQQNTIKEVTNLIFEFDQILKKSSDALLVLAPIKEIADVLINHYRGQMVLHIASLLFQKQKIANNDEWRETIKKCLPFLVFAFQSSTVDTDSFFLKNSTNVIQNYFSHLKKEGAYRCVQAARTILACKSKKYDVSFSSNFKQWFSIEDIFNQIRETCVDNSWRKNVFRHLFANADQQSKIATSYFVQNSFFHEPNYDSISFNEIELYEDMAQFLYPSSLSHYVYLGLCRRDLHTYITRTFNALNFSTSNLINCNPETINRVDLDSFLYCAIIQAKRRLEAEKSSYEILNNKPCEKPLILPAVNIIQDLCTDEQTEWWLNAFKMYKNISGDNFVHLKSLLQFGIEAVRGIDFPKMDTIILFKLGDILLARAIHSCDKIDEKRHLEIRVEYIYKCALNMMRNRETDNFRKIFKFSTVNYDINQEIEKMCGAAIEYLSSIYFKREQYKEFIEDFGGISNPWLHFFRAEAYKKMDESNKTPRKTRKLYVEKARDSLIEALSLIDDNVTIREKNILKDKIEKDLKMLQYDSSVIYNDEFELHNISQNGYTDEDIFHNASSSSFRGRKEVSLQMQNYHEKINEMEVHIKNVSETMIKIKDDMASIRKDICGLKDDVLVFRGEVADMNANKDTTVTKALGDVYKSIEDLIWNITYMNIMPNQANASSTIPGNIRCTPNPIQTQFNPMYNTAYPIYPSHFPPALGRTIPGQIPAHLPYNDPLGVNVIMNASNLNTPVIPSPQQQPQTLLNSGQKSSIIEALNTPSVLSTWTNSFNQQAISQQLPVTVTTCSATLPQPHKSSSVKELPVNVVITSSDPLPTQKAYVQPALSVTIPPQHIKHSSTAQYSTDINNAPLMYQSANLPVFDDTLKLDSSENSVKQSNSQNIQTSDKIFNADKKEETVALVNIDNTPKSSVQINTSTLVFSNLKETAASSEKINQTQSPFANFSFGSKNKSFSQLFSNSSDVKPEEKSQKEMNNSKINDKSMNEEDEIEHYESTAQFDPVISLPELVDVKTGEEDELVVFSNRAKLLRFDSTAKEWKERGIGEMKILVNKTDNSKARFLMRREQVLKICCNMPITKDLKLVKMNLTAMSFGGYDYSDEEMKIEKLTIKFKTADLANKFSETVLQVQKNVGDVKIITEKEADKKKSVEGFGDAFKPKSGSWTCETCYVTNKPENLYCAACESPKDSTVPKKDVKAPVVSTTNFSFGLPNASGFSFGIPIVSATNNTTSNESKEPILTTNSTSGSNEIKSLLLDSNKQENSKPFSFGSSFQNILTKEEKGEQPSVVNDFGKTESKFNFVFKKKSPVKTKSPGKSRNESINSDGGYEEEANENDYHEEEENQTYFTPVIPLPDKIDAKTGEEDEVVIYSHRAKLFRFANKEWKERGIGDIKILKHSVNGKLRVIMRRDQVLKICLNFILTDEIIFTRKDDQSWTFAAVDFSEGEFEPTSFAVRFKTQEICEDFKNAIDNALRDSKDKSKSIEGNELNIIDNVNKLMLPKSFYDYETAPDCTGCLGCKSDSYRYPKADNSMCSADAKRIPLNPPALKFKSKATAQQKHVSFKIAERKQNDLKEIFKDSSTNEKFDDSKKNVSISSNMQNVFGVQNANTDKSSIFSSSLNTAPKATSNIDFNSCQPSLFGSKVSFGTSNTGSNIFGNSINENKTAFGIFGVTDTMKSSASIQPTNNDTAFKNLFGSSSQGFSFVEAAKDLDKTFDSKQNSPFEENFLTKGNKLSGFAELAQASSSLNKPFGMQNNNTLTSGTGGFYGLTVKNDFFSKNLSRSSQISNEEAENNSSENVNDENYDPHYDPIISLPDEVQVSTGEEEENKIFGERAKLFRYDSKLKEWKERGVGEIKVLHHPKNNTYRMILRREQIFKLVLNQLVVPDTQMSPMDNSSKAFCWAGMNYAEGNGELEQLAIRFKNEDIAQKFKAVIDECQTKLKSTKNLEPQND